MSSETPSVSISGFAVISQVTRNHQGPTLKQHIICINKHYRRKPYRARLYNINGVFAGANNLPKIPIIKPGIICLDHKRIVFGVCYCVNGQVTATNKLLNLLVGHIGLGRRVYLVAIASFNNNIPRASVKMSF